MMFRGCLWYCVTRTDSFALQEDGDLIPTDADGNIVLSDVDYLATWREMETCVHLGLTHSIGLSNFNSQQIERLLVSAEVKPANLQVQRRKFDQLHAIFVLRSSDI